MPNAQGSSCRSNGVFKQNESVTDRQTHRDEQTVPKPAKKQPQNKTKQRNKKKTPPTTMNNYKESLQNRGQVTPPLSCAASDHSW